jgi:hypothetical protein
MMITTISLTRTGSVMNSKNLSGGERRGFALLTVIMLTLAMAALAASAVYMAGNAGLLATSTDREREFKYGAEAAMAIGKSRLNTDPLVLPDTGFVTILSGQAITGADGVALPGVTVNLYTGPTGSSSGQFGRFASVVAEARDASGARFVRRLELTQESFAKFAYFSNKETNTSGGTIYFANQDNLWGPVWSNDNISIATTGARFHGDVGTAKSVLYTVNPLLTTFDKGFSINQPVIVLPNNTTLSKLSGYAAAGFTNWTAPSNGDASTVRLRAEFVAIDLGTGTADSTGIDEGFVKFYQANAGEEKWLRGDWTTTKANASNCGMFYRVNAPGPAAIMKFFPASVHGTSWMKTFLTTGGLSSSAANTIGSMSVEQIMAQAGARCFLGGDPRLAAEERIGLVNGTGPGQYITAKQQIGGEDTTFTPTGMHGKWLAYTGVVDPRVLAKRPNDAGYLFPIYRGLNPGTKGVIAVTGTVGISGVLRGKITLYATGTVVILDDQRYATDPSVTNAVGAPTVCPDVLGVIAGANITVADNAINNPPNVSTTSTANYKTMDDTKDLFLHGTMMALNESFGVENYSSGANNAMDCEGTNGGRGCLYLTGGLIQERRGAVGLLSGEGYIKRYSYDRCALSSPPPFFPTTGRFLDNRYYEIDPVRFNITTLFAGLTPN